MYTAYTLIIGKKPVTQKPRERERERERTVADE